MKAYSFRVLVIPVGWSFFRRRSWRIAYKIWAEVMNMIAFARQPKPPAPSVLVPTHRNPLTGREEWH